MAKLILIVLILASFTSPIYAQMSTGQGGSMMGGGWWDRMGYGSGFGIGWIFIIVIAVLVIVGFAYMMKRR